VKLFDLVKERIVGKGRQMTFFFVTGKMEINLIKRVCLNIKSLKKIILWITLEKLINRKRFRNISEMILSLPTTKILEHLWLENIRNYVHGKTINM
jgi:hypothetical protein